MRTDVFPLNYFKDLWTPKQILRNKSTFNWWQIGLLILFLNALMIIPVSLHYANMERFPIENTFPNAFELIDQAAVEQLQQAKFEAGQMTLDSKFELDSENGTVRGGMSEKEAEETLQDESHAILFLKDSFILKEANQPAAKVPYTNKISFEQAGTVEEVKDILSQEWLIKNQTFVVASFSFILYVLLLTVLLLLIFGAALFSYFMFRNKTGVKRTYRHAVSKVLFAVGLPTILAMIVGVIEFNVLLMMTIQSVGMIGYVWALYYQSRMNQLKEKKEQKAADEKAAHVPYSY